MQGEMRDVEARNKDLFETVIVDAFGRPLGNQLREILSAENVAI